jgi:aminoglycoside phosphotransferase (APT) family kinase protein
MTFEPLTGGMRNLNVVLQVDGIEDRLVLRIYKRDLLACRKEVELHNLISGWIPVPEILYADPAGAEDIGPYMLMRYVEGVTFQKLKSKGSPEETAEAAYAIGSTLAKFQLASSGSRPPLIEDVPTPISEIFERWLSTPIVGQRLGIEVRDQLRDFVFGWASQMSALDRDRLLVHGDFSARNTIVRQSGGSWVVTGVLDWELARFGPRLWDVARFICFEPRTRPIREPHFSRGFAENGGSLPENWSALARIINAVSATESLTQPDLPEAFARDLKNLIVATMTGADPA